MYPQVDKSKNSPREPTIYSDLGAGGGRLDPKLTVQPSHYAEAKDFAPQYSTTPKSWKGSYMDHDGEGIGDDHKEFN